MYYAYRMNPISQWSLTDRGSIRNAWVLWVLAVMIVMMVVAFDPDDRTVTPNYRDAAVAWFHGEAMYQGLDDIHGFLYLPQAALIYAPVVPLAKSLGEPLGRALMTWFFVFGLFQLCRLEDREGGDGRMFLIVTLACLPLAVGNIRNGQYNLLMGGAWMLAAATLGRGQWWRCALWLTLGVAIKPIGIVMLLLVGVVWWRSMAWRLAVCLAGMLLLPFVLQRPGYVAEQYGLFFRKLQTAGSPTIPEWYDINGIIRNGLGITLPAKVLTGIRGVAAVATLGVVWLVSWRFDLRWAGVWTLIAAVMYLMLFNPRTEGPTFLMLMPVLGLAIGWAWYGDWPGGWKAAACLIVAAVAINFSFDLFNGLGALTGEMMRVEPKQYWFRPVIVAGLGCYLFFVMLKTSRQSSRITA